MTREQFISHVEATRKRFAAFLWLYAAEIPRSRMILHRNPTSRLIFHAIHFQTLTNSTPGFSKSATTRSSIISVENGLQSA